MGLEPTHRNEKPDTTVTDSKELTNVFRRSGLLFETRNGTLHLRNKVEKSVADSTLKKMRIDRRARGWDAFRRFLDTQLRGKCQERTSEIFGRATGPRLWAILFPTIEEVELRLAGTAEGGLQISTCQMILLTTCSKPFG